MGEDIAYLERFLVAEQILQVAELEIGIEQKRFDASFLCEQAPMVAMALFPVPPLPLTTLMMCAPLTCETICFAEVFFVAATVVTVLPGVSLAGGVKSFRGGTGETVPREKDASEVLSSGMSLAS